MQERNRLFKLLKEVPFLVPYPSYSNFILCEVTSGIDAKKLKVCFEYLSNHMEIDLKKTYLEKEELNRFKHDTSSVPLTLSQ